MMQMDYARKVCWEMVNPPMVTVSDARLPATDPEPYLMTTCELSELDGWSDVDFEVWKRGVLGSQSVHVSLANQRSEEPVSRMTSKFCALF